MKILSNKEKLNNTSVAIGNFDGVHLAHKELIKRAVSEKGDLLSVVYTFHPHPGAFFGKEISLIQTEEEKREEIKRCGADILYIEKCDREFLSESPYKFAKEVLKERLGAKKVFVGFDFTFGYKGEGKAEDLISFGEKLGFSVTVLPEIKGEDGKALKSSTVREYILKGKMKEAEKILGRPYLIGGEVIHCKGLGKNLGFPTANIFPGKDKILPPFGVYAVKVLVDGENFNAIANLGINPTVEKGDIPKLEVNILDFDKDIYGKSIKVEFKEMLRKEKKFENAEELKAQIEKDVKNFKKCLTNG